ncbi:MAG: hypothetical protein ACM36C_09970, partial [Acidobacteriota bacterium]
MGILFRSPAAAVFTIALVATPVRVLADPAPRTELTTWSIQSSARLSQKGDTLSGPGVNTADWHQIKVP